MRGQTAPYPVEDTTEVAIETLSWAVHIENEESKSQKKYEKLPGTNSYRLHAPWQDD